MFILAFIYIYIAGYPHVPTHFGYKPNVGRNVIVLAAENRDKCASIWCVTFQLDILPPLCFTKKSTCWFINIQPFKFMDVHPKWPMLYNRQIHIIIL